MEILKNPNFDFLGKARYFISASLIIILAGLAFMLTRGIYLGKNAKGYGVEFSGGTQIIARFEKTPEIDHIRDAVNEVAPGAVIQTYDKPATNQVLIRLAGASEGDLDAIAKRVLDLLSTRYTQNPVKEHSSEVVGPVVGAELRRKAVQLTIFGLVFQLIYIAI